ncbi:hypothetical protein KKF91_08450 [Myxococcota bacterium]|nr:hypothetical protein [Myxococcota bacterium]MBU1430569.1 hypothetical protein [Myxococcota bacterium]MBU1899833.1 hypothetical protein [Myxococcota bacterium]
MIRQIHAPTPRPTPRPRRALAVALLLSFSLLGCEENLDPATPDGAFHQVRDALMAGDLSAVLATTSQTTHDHLAALLTLLKEQRRAFDEDYPEDFKLQARLIYPSAALNATDSEALFAALVGPDLKALKPDEGLHYGLSVAKQPVIEGDRATLTTRSGETLEMVLEEGRWKTTAFERAIEQDLRRARLNQQTLDHNLKIIAEMKRRAAEEAAKAKAEATP